MSRRSYHREHGTDVVINDRKITIHHAPSMGLDLKQFISQHADTLKDVDFKENNIHGHFNIDRENQRALLALHHFKGKDGREGQRCLTKKPLRLPLTPDELRQALPQG